MAPSGAGKIRQLGFPNPDRFKESSSCALGWRRRHRRRETLFSCRKKSMLNTVRFAIVASFSRWSQRTRPQVRHKSHIINKSKEKLQTNLINIACLNLVVVIILVNKILSLDQSWCWSSSDQDAHQLSLSVQFHFSEHPLAVSSDGWLNSSLDIFPELPYLAMHLLSINMFTCILC